MLLGIQDMKHHIKTSFGLSKLALNKQNSETPFQGILQGNGASSTTWVLISIPLLNMLRAKGHGAKCVSSISQELTHVVGFAFVDDSDLITFDMFEEEKSWDELQDCMQEAINRWEGGLKTTGGALVPSKSWIYPISFKFDSKGEATYKNLEEMDTNFTVLNKDGNIESLTCVESHKGRETLGVFLCPDDNNKEAVHALAEKAKRWRDNIHSGHLQPGLA